MSRQPTSWSPSWNRPSHALTAMVAKPNFMHIAPAIKDPLIALQIKFEELMSQAQAVQVSGSGKIDADVKTLAQDLATYRKQYQLATSMLGLMERGSRRPVCWSGFRLSRSVEVPPEPIGLDRSIEVLLEIWGLLPNRARLRV